MRTHLLAVGKLRPAFRTASDDYLRRIGRYGVIIEHEVREAGRAGTPALARSQEALRLAGALPAGGTVVALDQAGTPWSSEQLAAQLDRWRLAARPVSLVLGGSGGLDPELLRGADARWSLGPLTLPHELARVIVLEQWYRAWTILRGEPYHRGGRG